MLQFDKRQSITLICCQIVQQVVHITLILNVIGLIGISIKLNKTTLR